MKVICVIGVFRRVCEIIFFVRQVLNAAENRGMNLVWIR